MKTLALTVLITLTVHSQELLSADGTTWNYIASGRDKDGAKFNVFARKVDGGQFPALEVKFGHNDRVQAEHDCKRGLYRFKGGKWVKPAGAVGAKLIKFACGKN